MILIRALFLGTFLCLTLSGCGPRPAETNVTGLGPDLREVAKAKGTRLEYKADRAGKLYLYDYNTNQFLYSGDINAGETFVLEPASNRAMLGKQTLDLDYPANAFDDYRLYLSEQ